MSKTQPPDGCAALAFLSISIILFIGIILFLTQKTYIINYFGVESTGKIIKIDSVHTGSNKYKFTYSIQQPSGKLVQTSEGNYHDKTYQLDETVKIKTYKNESVFKTQSPNFYMLIPLLLLFGLFVRVYFVFK